MNNDIINIGSRREVFWDDTMIDTEETTTVFRLHEPVQRECVLTFDKPWSKSSGDATYNTVLQDGNLYRMYTRVTGNVAYAESTDAFMRAWAENPQSLADNEINSFIAKVEQGIKLEFNSVSLDKRNRKLLENIYSTLKDRNKFVAKG